MEVQDLVAAARELPAELQLEGVATVVVHKDPPRAGSLFGRVVPDAVVPAPTRVPLLRKVPHASVTRARADLVDQHDPRTESLRSRVFCGTNLSTSIHPCPVDGSRGLPTALLYFGQSLAIL